MTICPYLSFDGNCEEAFLFYARCFGGQVAPLFRFEGSPMAGSVPPEWGQKIMHGSVTIGGLELMGADSVPGGYSAPKGFVLSVQMADSADAERVFAELEIGGTVQMALQQTFWAERYGMVTDRFGIPWQINCAANAAPAA
jgi:PhnB protein